MNQDYYHALPAGARIECYEIKNVLGVGGFGITYRAAALAALSATGASDLTPGTDAECSADTGPSPLSELRTVRIDTAAPADLPWRAEMLQALETDLAVYLGPIARILVSRAAKKTVDPETLVQMLAAEIPQDDHKAAFVRRAKRQSIRVRSRLN